ncbi:hypothetical protein NDU88_006574 [Pleurodeles waltl]|uniref:Uncharacterized protein n=1 Tax=Pleurodeles waltl TaxID=8319 RepID=A0AAV7SPV7_PLEWA|nr:hypothetical protein NDU88_006574 [Pleurodeles waltl]
MALSVLGHILMLYLGVRELSRKKDWIDTTSQDEVLLKAVDFVKKGWPPVAQSASHARSNPGPPPSSRERRAPPGSAAQEGRLKVVPPLKTSEPGKRKSSPWEFRGCQPGSPFRTRFFCESRIRRIFLSFCDVSWRGVAGERAVCTPRRDTGCRVPVVSVRTVGSTGGGGGARAGDPGGSAMEESRQRHRAPQTPATAGAALGWERSA